MADKHTANAVAAMDYDAETAWIYQNRLRYRSTADIAAMAKRPPIRDERGRFTLDGGLGRTLSVRTIQRRLIEAAQAHTDELDELVPQYRAISLARYEEQARVASAQIARLLERAGYVYEKGMAWDEVILDIHAEKALNAAVQTLARVEERIDKLLGLDAAVEVNVTVEHYDAEAEELRQMLDEAAGAGKTKRKKAKA